MVDNHPAISILSIDTHHQVVSTQTVCIVLFEPPVMSVERTENFRRHLSAVASMHAGRSRRTR